MLIGYARTSTLEQVAGLEAQERDLAALGCEKVYAEQTSSVGDRPRLTAALDYLREGDTLVVTKLDRLARSVIHMGEILNKIREKGASLRIVGMGIDTSTPTGALMLNMLASVAQFEREMMLERQREGIAKAKNEGKYKGRKPAPQSQIDEVKRLHGEGVSPTDIAKKLGIGRTSVYRALGNVKPAKAA